MSVSMSSAVLQVCTHAHTHAHTKRGQCTGGGASKSRGGWGMGHAGSGGKRMVYPQNGTHPTVPFTKLHRRDKRKYCVNYYSSSQLIIKLK